MINEDHTENKTYVNDSLKIAIELPTVYFHDAREYNLGLSELGKTQVTTLSMAKVDPRRDQVLFADPKTIIVLRNKPVDLDCYRAFGIIDTVSRKFMPLNEGGFFRNITTNKKSRMMVIDDLIPYQDRYLSIISYYKPMHPGAGRESSIDPTDPNDMIYFENFLHRTLYLSRTNVRNLLVPQPIKVNDGFKLLTDYFQQGAYNNYYAPCQAEIRSPNYRNDREKAIYWQAMATFYGFAQEPPKADSVWKLYVHFTENKEFERSSDLQDLLLRVDTSQVVMFNEAHHCPHHRYLVGTLLQEFYDRGFRYLGLETFINDSLWEARKYPTVNNGFYSKDPVFANLIRAAADLGMEVFGYESWQQGESREVGQARKIYNVIQKDPEAKILILAGYDHITPKWMAGKFHEISGIKPLTINQTYTYLLRLDNPERKNEAFIVDPDSFTDTNYRINADIFLWNDLRIGDNVFGLKPVSEITTVIPRDIKYASVFGVYRKTEWDGYDPGSGVGKPIPVFVRVLKKEEESVRYRLGSGTYTAVIFDDYAQQIHLEEINVP